MKTSTQIRKAIESFCGEWSRHEWMQEYGEWASTAWDSQREDYEIAYNSMADTNKTLVEAIDAVSMSGELSDSDEFEEALDAARALLAELEALLASARRALDDQVRPDESDYIAEGTIDPDDVKGDARQGWDCKEGWDAYRVGDALYMHWWREAYGNRHYRNLWVLVDGEFFAE